jgi:hypothetical protein
MTKFKKNASQDYDKDDSELIYKVQHLLSTYGTNFFKVKKQMLIKAIKTY